MLLEAVGTALLICAVCGMVVVISTVTVAVTDYVLKWCFPSYEAIS